MEFSPSGFFFAYKPPIRFYSSKKTLFMSDKTAFYRSSYKNGRIGFVHHPDTAVTPLALS